MDAFAPVPPAWTQAAVHAHEFCCPTCRAASAAATEAWINRRSPVFTEDHRRKWQEFYHCSCGTTWWAWSTDRAVPEFNKTDSSDPLWDDIPDL